MSKTVLLVLAASLAAAPALAQQGEAQQAAAQQGGTQQQAGAPGTATPGQGGMQAQNEMQAPPPGPPVSLSPPLVARIQRELKAAGLYQGEIDGKMGPQTRKAVEQFQSSNNLRPTGVPDTATMLALNTQAQQGQQAAQQGQQGAQPGQQTPAQRLQAYQAREGAATRPGTATSAGWAASAAPGEGALSPLASGSLTQANGTLTSVQGSMANAGARTEPGGTNTPTGFFGYGNMSNGFNAATGREP